MRKLCEIAGLIKKSTAASGPAGDEWGVGECRHLDEGGFLYECFCSFCVPTPTPFLKRKQLLIATTKAGATAATTKAAAATTKAVVTVKLDPLQQDFYVTTPRCIRTQNFHSADPVAC
ncbi:unnamed protein product, partial [Mesorhabditis spiculigera]